MRLIDADALLKAVKSSMESGTGNAYPALSSYLYLPIEFCDLIEKVPTADAVEVVRCRDCVYRSIYPNSDKQYWCNQWYTKVVYENGYCYRGKKDNDK